MGAPVRPGLRRSGPLCAAPACAGVPCRRRGPPAGASGRPLAVVVGGWCPPPPPPRGPSRARPGCWRRGPPLGGLAWRFPWPGAAPCSPHGGGVGPLAPPPCGRYCWPLLLSPEEDAERRRRPASRRAVSISAMAYSAVTVLLSWFSARRTLSMSPYFCSKSTA